MQSRSRDAAFVILASVFWGTSFPGSKLVIDEVDPLFLTLARIAIGSLLGLGILALLGRLDWTVFRRPYVWVLGALNAIGFDLQNVGIFYTTASKTALLVNVNIVFIAILMAIVFKERLTRLKGAGVLTGVVGVVVLATKLNLANLSGGEFLGDALVFLSGLTWSFYVIGTKKMVDRGGDYLALTTGVLVTTALFAALPVIALSTPAPTGDLAWVGISYLGLVPTFLPLVLYTYSMRTLSPTISSLLVLLEVVVAAVLSAVFLREVLDLFTVAGGALILFGAYIVARGDREIPEPGASGLAPVPRDTTLSGANGPTSASVGSRGRP